MKSKKPKLKGLRKKKRLLLPKRLPPKLRLTLLPKLKLMKLPPPKLRLMLLLKLRPMPPLKPKLLPLRKKHQLKKRKR